MNLKYPRNGSVQILLPEAFFKLNITNQTSKTQLFSTVSRIEQTELQSLFSVLKGKRPKREHNSGGSHKRAQPICARPNCIR